MEAVETVLDMTLVTLIMYMMVRTIWLYRNGRDWQFCGWVTLLNIALYTI